MVSSINSLSTSCCKAEHFCVVLHFCNRIRSFQRLINAKQKILTSVNLERPRTPAKNYVYQHYYNINWLVNINHMFPRILILLFIKCYIVINQQKHIFWIHIQLSFAVCNKIMLQIELHWIWHTWLDAMNGAKNKTSSCYIHKPVYNGLQIFTCVGIGNECEYKRVGFSFIFLIFLWQQKKGPGSELGYLKVSRRPGVHQRGRCPAATRPGVHLKHRYPVISCPWKLGPS